MGESFKNLFNSAEGKRIIIATFSSNIHRIQQIIDQAIIHDRKVAISGRSMQNVIAKAVELNYVRIPEGMLIDIEDVNKYPPEKLVICTTGSQGEPLSALSRMSSGDHRQVTITPMDFIIISATPIPGNEKLVTKVVRGSRIRPRLPGRAENDDLADEAEVLYPDTRRIQALEEAQQARDRHGYT